MCPRQESRCLIPGPLVYLGRGRRLLVVEVVFGTRGETLDGVTGLLRRSMEPVTVSRGRQTRLLVRPVAPPEVLIHVPLLPPLR